MQFRLFHVSWFPALQYFSDYLQRGYYPFTNDDIPQYIQQVVNATIDTKTPKYLEIWKLLANFAHTIINSTNNMRINKTFVTLGLATALLQMPASSFAQTSGASHKQNPLLSSSTLPFGAPDFSKIQESDYLPAIKAGNPLLT